MIYFTLFSAISKVDSKGRISIPIGLRLKLNLLEGSIVKIALNDKKLIIIPNGQSGVRVSTKVCGTLRPGSSLGSGLKNKKGE